MENCYKLGHSFKEMDLEGTGINVFDRVVLCITCGLIQTLKEVDGEKLKHQFKNTEQLQDALIKKDVSDYLYGYELEDGTFHYRKDFFDDNMNVQMEIVNLAMRKINTDEEEE